MKKKRMKQNMQLKADAEDEVFIETYGEAAFEEYKVAVANRTEQKLLAYDNYSAPSNKRARHS
jgi:hypothetical protein